MPTYEYRCAQGHDFEAFQRMSEEPLDTCPECGAAAERQLSAGAGILFKGEGFYITDYRSDSYKKAAAADGKSAAGEGSKKDGASGSTGASGTKAAGTDGGTSKSKGGGASSGSSD